MASDSWTLVEALQEVAGPRWDQWTAAKTELAALPTVGRRIVSAGISPYDSGLEGQRQRQVSILAQRAPVERRVQTLWNEIWSAIQSKMMSGPWTSVGSRGSATAMPAPINGPGWAQLSVDRRDQSVLIERGTKVRIFNVRILPGESWELMRKRAVTDQGSMECPTVHTPFSGWALDEAVERMVGKAIGEASSTALIHAIASGHLVPYLPNKDGGSLELIDKSDGGNLVKEYFNDRAMRETVNRGLILFPTICAPDAPDLLNGLSLAYVMSTYVLKDPEFLRWAPLAIAADEAMRRFVERGWYYPNGWSEWRVTVGTLDPEDELEFEESPIGILMEERSEADLNVRQARLVARHRFGCLMQLLSTSRIEALGDPLRSRDNRQILASVWSDDAYYINAERGHLLVENPNSQDRHDVLILRYRAVLLRKPGAIAPAAELQDQGNPPVGTRPTTFPEVREACRAWLAGLMRQSPDLKPKPKSAYQTDACEKWPALTNEGFNKSWEEAIKESGAAVWGKSGRPRGTTRKSK